MPYNLAVVQDENSMNEVKYDKQNMSDCDYFIYWNFVL